MDNISSAQNLTEENRFLSWEKKQLKLEVKALQDWIDEHLQQEFEKVQMFGPSRATLRHQIKRLEETVRGLQHELGECNKAKSELRNKLLEKEEEIFKLTMDNGVVMGNRDALTDRVMLAEQAMQGPNSLQTYHAELDKLVKKPPVVPRTTLPPSTKSYMRRLNLSNSFASVSEDFSLSHAPNVTPARNVTGILNVTAVPNSRQTRSRTIRLPPTQPETPARTRTTRSRSRSSRTSRSRTSFRTTDSSVILAEHRRLRLSAGLPQA